MSQPKRTVPALLADAEPPEFAALTPNQRRFVFAVATSPGRDHTSLLEELEPGINHHTARVKAWRWMHTPKVQQALLALVPGETVKMFPVVLKNLHDIAQNPQAKDHAKVLLKLHEWYAPRHSESTLNVNVKGSIDMNRSELLQRVQQQLQELGPVGEKVLAAVATKAVPVDAEFEEIDPLEGLPL